MDNLIASFNAVAPICLVVVAGMLLHKINLMPTEFVSQASRLLYRFIMPVMVFSNVYFASVEFSNWAFPLYAIVAIPLGYVLSALVSLKAFPNNRRRAASCAQGMVRSNYLVIGMSMSTALMGPEAAGSISILTPFAVALYALGANMIFALFLQEGKIQWKQTIKSLLSTPILWGVFLGILLKMVPLNCPVFIKSTVQNIATISAPFALLILGAQLDLSALGRNMKPVLFCSLGRLVVFPVILFLPALLWMQFDRYELAALFFLFFTPSAVNSYFEAIAKNADYEYSGEVVAFTTLLSFITLFGAIFILKQFGVF